MDDLRDRVAQALHTTLDHRGSTRTRWIECPTRDHGAEADRLVAAASLAPESDTRDAREHTPLEVFGHAVGIALAERKVPDDWDAANLTPEQMLEATARLLDTLDDATDTYLAARGSDHRVDRSMQRDLDALRAALAHPESDTRGLDVERLAVALMGSAVGTCHHHPAWTEEAAAAQARRLAAAYAEPAHPDDIAAIREYGASPDLSIDREGHHDTDDCFDQPERHHPQCPKPGGGWCNCGAQQDINREVFARHAAIRGTTQPEPTE